MGKSLPPTASLQQFATRIIASNNHRPKRIEPPVYVPRVAPTPDPSRRRWVRLESEQQLRVNHKKTMTEEVRRPEDQQRQNNRLPLAGVVSDCVKRWFQETLKEAKDGDGAMQILVGQMYCKGYGVIRDDHKGRAWLNRASKSRSSAWKVGDKQPGYNASDSDSDDMKGDTK